MCRFALGMELEMEEARPDLGLAGFQLTSYDVIASCRPIPS